MSPKNWLSITIQDDGDIIVGMFMEENMHSDGTAFPQVEFCTISAGGRSPRTREVLKELFDAIHLDNEEEPIEDQPKDHI